jgi:hypothetical protein
MVASPDMIEEYTPYWYKTGPFTSEEEKGIR